MDRFAERRRRAWTGPVLCVLLACLAVPERGFGQQDRAYSYSLREGRVHEAEAIAREQLAQYAAAGDQANVQVWCHNLAIVLRIQGKIAEAEPLALRSQALAEGLYGPQSDEAIGSAWNLASILSQRGRYADAVPLFRRALEARERQYGPVHLQTQLALIGLGECYSDSGRLTEAERLLKLGVERGDALARTVATAREVVEAALLPHVLGALGNVYVREGRLAEAQPLLRRALDVQIAGRGPEHPDLNVFLDNLAMVYTKQGRYAEAERLQKRALEIGLKVLGRNNQQVIESYNNVAVVYQAQHRYKEMEALLTEGLALAENVLGPEHPRVATFLQNLGLAYLGLEQLDLAESYLRRSLAATEKAEGKDSVKTAGVLVSLGGVEARRGQYREALTFYEKAGIIYEQRHGLEHPDTIEARVLHARILYRLKEDEAALRLLDQAITVAERDGLSADFRFVAYKTQADLHSRAGRRDDAIRDLRRALELAEQAREDVSESARYQAENFAGALNAFEEMVAWQAERGDLAETFATIERFHARSLLDEMRMAGADPLAGRPAAEREQLRQREATLKTRIAELEMRLELASKDKALKTEAQSTADLLASARKALEAFQAEVRRTSPVTRELLTRQAKVPSLSEVQRLLLKPGDLLLCYLFGDEGGYVLAATPEQVSFARLSLDDDQARVLNAKAGPLTAKVLRSVLQGDKDPGVLAGLSDPRAGDVTPALAALWSGLVPETQRKALLDGTVKRLLVEADGSLALLPFEALVVEEGTPPKYLLDAGPPVVYGPSATILLNLATQPPVAPAVDREPVLAVGDPAYPQSDAVGADTGSRGALPARSRYSMAGGVLARLPYSGWEAQWVAKAFNDQGIKAGVYTGESATERAVRFWAPGRTILHLACHGLADQKFESLFAALAVAPGPRGALDPSDDGFLTLAEIYGLNLKGCELAILSACQSNIGPQQKGEGTWAVSRGFLVAGARRVVASNWLVDDEAAASLVSVFCTGLAREQKGSGTPDYARSLQAAKRWVRQQDRWKAPYYWASLVMVGTN